MIINMQTIEELKEVVFVMSPMSTAGLDLITTLFLQKCWHILKHDLLEVLIAFISSLMIPKHFSHSHTFLLPKVSNPIKMREYRPISLSNITSKIFSKFVCYILSSMLLGLIFLNQSGFVKGRNISENIFLSQEVIHYIRKPIIGSNIIIILDMEKAYDRISLFYICLVLRKMSFDEKFINMVWRIIDNNWYCIIIYGYRYGFFHSTRGLK